MKTLTAQQQSHCDRLYSIITSNGFAYDVSATGAGKTVVSLKLSKILDLPVTVVAPPTLSNNWKTEAANENVDLIFISNCNVKVVSEQSQRLLIVDESHAFKNNTKRTYSLLENKSTFPFVLFLSATPYDHPRQQAMFKKFTSEKSALVFSRVEFTHATTVSNYLLCVSQTTQDEQLYRHGKRNISRANQISDDGTLSFSPAVFNNGLKKIHDSLMNSLETLVCEYSSKDVKLIVCLRFSEHFSRLKSLFPNALVLNGSTDMRERKLIIKKFQTSSWKNKLILLSAAVGGIGIDLDDQTGGYPRVILTLPLFISEYVQLIGRVQRRSSYSDAQSFVLQPKQTNTYFIHQLGIKSTVLKQFGCQIEFAKRIQHLDICLVHFVGLYFGKALDLGAIKTIGAFLCLCKQ